MMGFECRLLAMNLSTAVVGKSEAVDPGLQAQAFHSKNRSNITKSKFKSVDAALEKAWRSFQNDAVRKEAYCDYVRAVVKQQPILFRSHNNFALIASNKVKGLTKPNLTLSRVHEAWLER